MKNNGGIEIFLGYNCSLRCRFCFQKDLRLKHKDNLSATEVKKIIYDGSLNDKKSIFFSGGDPMQDNNLLEYVIYAKSLGFDDIRIHTNGLVLSDMGIFEKYILAGVNGFIISIHGYEDVHNILVRSNLAFGKIKLALLNFEKLKKKYTYLVLDTNTVVNRHNYKTLYSLFKFLSVFHITRSQIVQPYSLGLFSENEKRSLYVKYEEFKPYLDEIFGIDNLNITLENFPFCKTEKKHYKHILEREKYNNNAFGYIGENLEESSCDYIDKCKTCEYREVCSGIPKDYLSLFKEDNYFTF